MNKPILYSTMNETQRISNIKTLKEYGEIINWRDAGDTAIDVGCGDGSFSVYIRKYKPKNTFCYKKFIACDINENMVKFAQEHYGEEDISFRVLDIGVHLPDDLKGSFNHVFSFYTLHWLKDQEKAFRNIYNLLADDGDILINFLASNKLSDIYKALADQPKWSTWLKHVDIFIFPHHFMENPEKVVSEVLKKIGFKNIKVQCKSMTSVLYTPQKMKNTIQSVEPFNMPQEVFDELMEDAFPLAKEHGFLNFNIDGISYDFRLLVISATKGFTS